MVGTHQLSPHTGSCGAAVKTHQHSEPSALLFFCLSLKRFHCWREVLQAEDVCSRELQGCLRDALSPDVPTAMKAVFIAPQLHPVQSSECGGATVPVLSLSFLLGSASEDPEPQDRYHGIYFAMLLAGVGFLLPYNSFITDVDYLHHKYPGRAPAAAALPAPQTWVEPHCLPLCRDLHSL